MPKEDDSVQSMKETARNLALQAKELREQARYLSMESWRVRTASEKARQARSKKKRKTWRAPQKLAVEKSRELAIYHCRTRGSATGIFFSSSAIFAMRSRLNLTMLTSPGYISFASFKSRKRALRAANGSGWDAGHMFAACSNVRCQTFTLCSIKNRPNFQSSIAEKATLGSSDNGERPWSDLAVAHKILPRQNQEHRATS
jgi:hypothetical protein